MAIQIGKYKRPGIFIEEFDKSVLSSNVTEGITNMVIGVSRKGPVNTPVRITNPSDLESIFGTLDRSLERKGSFFHRTVSKMLESSPVYAVNLLLADDNLDVIEYKSLSAASGYSNDVERTSAYRRFFDTTSFWKRDTESFLNITTNTPGNSNRVLNFTNLSDRAITVFVFKTSVKGFDRTLIEWFGTADKVPSYVNTIDFASDYMVDVLVVSGDWTSYKDIAVDSRWSQYFNADGLIKEQVQNFANNRNVNTLAFYTGLSLIPYFRDLTGKNIFIETTINRDTDKTGLFCAFNHDLVEADYFNGKIDLVGQTIAGSNVSNIEFLSYDEKIIENVDFSATPLDLPGNVFGLIGTHSFVKHAFDNGNGPATTGYVASEERTAFFAEGYVHNTGLTVSGSGSTFSVAVANLGGDPSYVVTGGKKIDLVDTTLVVDAANYSATGSYMATIVIDSAGVIKKVENFKKVVDTNTNPSVAASDIVLGYVTFTYNGSTLTSKVYTPITLNTTGFKVMSGSDYTLGLTASNSIEVKFLSTATQPNVKDYAIYRRFKMFNSLIDVLDAPSNYMSTLLIGTDKSSLSKMSVSNIVTSTLYNKSFVLNTNLSVGLLNDIISSKTFIVYKIDNEFLTGLNGVETKDSVADLNGVGVVAQYSDMYKKFYDGKINTGDYFFNNLNVTGTDVYDITFINGESVNALYNTGLTSSFAGYDYVVVSGSSLLLEMEDKFSVPGSELNIGVFTVTSDVVNDFFVGVTSSVVYKVNENVTNEVLTDLTTVYDRNLEITIKAYTVDDILTVDYSDSTFTATNPLNSIEGNSVISVISEDSNYKQTLEVSFPTGYVSVANKVLVSGSRYSEILIGDFLEADYDETSLNLGEVPRKLTRIVAKKAYAGDSSLVEITCDSNIKLVNFNGDYQTTSYKSVDNYANTYKGISMKGFKIREASMPDGTEAKQKAILNLVAKGTPLFKAITNKEAIDFRYLIDSFGLGLTELSKQQLVDICGERLDIFGFINMPSMKSFKKSTSPSFVNGEGVLQAEFIAKGGDESSNPAFLYSFAEGNGSTAVGYFMPYLTVDDNGRPASVPPAAWVATTYMRKHTSNISSLTPWTIAAGVNNGKITGIAGLEEDFDPSDIEFLNSSQMNPIVYKRNRGNVIETENTAQTLYKSALSYIHSREVLIELERELSAMLLDYQWKFNNQDVRAEIKKRADVICETYVSRGGLYDYFNKIDEENNTSDIIDNQMGVLDTFVEIQRGMGIIVNNITIMQTGGISSGGFK